MKVNLSAKELQDLIYAIEYAVENEYSVIDAYRTEYVPGDPGHDKVVGKENLPMKNRKLKFIRRIYDIQRKLIRVHKDMEE